MELTKRIYQTTLDVIETARTEGITTNTAADQIAERRIAAVRGIKTML